MPQHTATERLHRARLVESLESALIFARVVCGAEPTWLDAQEMLALWRARHSHGLEATDGAERDLRPATQLLAIVRRPGDGAPVQVYLSRALLDAGNLIALRHAHLALVRLVANVSARAEIAGERHGLQLCALDAPDDADDAVLVEQYPRPRLLPF